MVGNFSFNLIIDFELGFFMKFCKIWNFELLWFIYLIFNILVWYGFFVLIVIVVIMILIVNDIKYFLLILVMKFNFLKFG